MVNIDKCNPQKFFGSLIIFRSSKASSDQRIGAIDCIFPLGFGNTEAQFIAEK